MLGATEEYNKVNYIIFDLEATCWDQHNRSDNETIEIGAVKLNHQAKIVGEFQKYVRPLKFPLLSTFCKELTTIEQIDIDRADYFYLVNEEFKEWIGNQYILCSWGRYDRKQLEADCALSNLETEWIRRHISLKHQFTKIRSLRRNLGMSKALELEQITIVGTHHRGIDDARSITKIFRRHFTAWNFEVPN